MQLRKPFRGIFVLEDFDDSLVGLAVGYAVSAGLKVDDLDVTADFLVHALARFLPQRALVDQALQPDRHAVVFVPRILGQRIAHGVHDMGKRIQADHVGGAKGGAARPADQRSGQRINRIKADAQAFGMMDGRQHRKHADAVGNEVRRVLGADHALAQRGDQKTFEVIEDFGIGAGAGNQLNQMHVPRRVEKMHAAETVPLFLGKGARQLVDRQARSVAGEDGVRAQVRRDLMVEIFLPVHAFGNSLDDDVAIAQQFEVLAVVRGFDQVGAFLDGQRTGFEFFQVGHGLQHVAVRDTLLGRQLEQDDRDVGIDEMRGNLGAHDTGTQHGHFAHHQGMSGHGDDTPERRIS